MGVDINQYGPQSGRRIKENNTIVNMADIQDTTSRSGSLMGRLTLSASATAIRVGTANLTGRHLVNVINDSSTIIFLDFTSAINTSTSFLLNSGTGICFNLDPNEDTNLWCRSTENETDIGIWEVK